MKERLIQNLDSVKATYKVAKKKVKKFLTRDNIIKIVTVISGLALILTSILPYLVR